MILLSIIGLLIVAAGLPQLFVRNQEEVGVDHWYWLACTKALKGGQRFPPHLPNYLYDEEQSYPPVFPLLLYLLPAWVMERFRSWVPRSFQLLRILLLFAAMHLIHIQEAWIYACAGLLFVTTPMLVSYDVQLNPRGLSALTLDAFFIFLMVGIQQPLMVTFWIVTLGLVAVILLTHKMTTQLLFFVLPCLAVGLKQPVLLWLIPGGVLLAAVLSRGFYLKTLKAHWEIVSFWNEQWRWIGSDPLRESPLYGQPGYVSALRQFEPGLRNYVKRLGSLFLGNYAPITLATLVLLTLRLPLDASTYYLSVWFVACVVFAVLTVMVPFLRGLGFGNLYLYNAAFPATLLFAYGLQHVPFWAKPLAGIVLLLNGFLVIRSFRHYRRLKIWTLSPAILAEMKRYEKGAWLCFPMQLMEHVAHLAEKPVLWGGHGGSLKKVRRVFPILRTDLRQLMAEDGLRYILVDESHRPDIEKIDIPQKPRFSADGFHIIELL